MATVINLTSHNINVFSMDGRTQIALLPKGDEAKVVEFKKNKSVNHILMNGFKVPILGKSFGQVTGLPEPKDDTFYVVSRVVKNNSPDRTDLVIPAHPIRDWAGRPIGCKSFME
jgi:hypothetical protein